MNDMVGCLTFSFVDQKNNCYDLRSIKILQENNARMDFVI